MILPGGAAGVADLSLSFCVSSSFFPNGVPKKDGVVGAEDVVEVAGASGFFSPPNNELPVVGVELDDVPSVGFGG